MQLSLQVIIPYLSIDIPQDLVTNDGSEAPVSLQKSKTEDQSEKHFSIHVKSKQTTPPNQKK